VVVVGTVVLVLVVSEGLELEILLLSHLLGKKLPDLFVDVAVVMLVLCATTAVVHVVMAVVVVMWRLVVLRPVDARI
jgi:hypothetical protein